MFDPAAVPADAWALDGFSGRICVRGGFLPTHDGAVAMIEELAIQSDRGTWGHRRILWRYTFEALDKELETAGFPNAFEYLSAHLALMVDWAASPVPAAEAAAGHCGPDVPPEVVEEVARRIEWVRGEGEFRGREGRDEEGGVDLLCREGAMIFRLAGGGIREEPAPVPGEPLPSWTRDGETFVYGRPAAETAGGIVPPPPPWPSRSHALLAFEEEVEEFPGDGEE